MRQKDQSTPPADGRRLSHGFGEFGTIAATSSGVYFCAQYSPSRSGVFDWACAAPWDARMPASSIPVDTV
jgi:hypothetical protein